MDFLESKKNKYQYPNTDSNFKKNIFYRVRNGYKQRQRLQGAHEVHGHAEPTVLLLNLIHHKIKPEIPKLKLPRCRFEKKHWR